MVNTDFYKNAKIYKIVDNTNGNIYIGSTCKLLCQRLSQHRSDYKGFLNGSSKKFMSSFYILHNEDYNIILLENVEDCKTIEHLRARERLYIENNTCVNRVIPTRTKKQWEDDNKEYRKEYKYQYQIDNKEHIKEYKHQYRIDNKEQLKARKSEKISCIHCGICYTRHHKARHERTKTHLNKT